MDKFLKYGMGIMGLLLLQMVEVKGDGTDSDTETGGPKPQLIVLAVVMLIILYSLNSVFHICRICCEHYIDEFKYYRSQNEESIVSIV